jgi:fructuronate reductase
VGLVAPLGPARLATLPAGVGRPAYDRAALRSGIVHLGLGAFVRAHLALATEAALNAGADPCWGICGVSLRHADVRDALAPQQGLYTVATRDADDAGRARERLQVVGCVHETLVAPEDPAAVLARIAAPTARIVSLTVTEKGYCRDPADPAQRALHHDHPDIRADLADAAAPRSALGFIVRGLALRRAGGLGGLTLLPLDNLPANGATLHALVLALADRIDTALARWIDTHCSFPASMVDRIVPRTTPADVDAVARGLGCRDAAPVIAEPFFDWAVEDRFFAGRPDWPCGGARLVASAEPFERLKLRMVNGAHSCIAYLGAMAGWPTVDAALRQPAMRAFVDALLRDEVVPTLPALPGLDVEAYRASLLQRFANPALAHRTQQIAMDGSQKLPQRLLGTVRDRLAQRQPVSRLAFGLAAWLHYLRGLDERGNRYPIEDPQADALERWRLAAAAAGDAAAEARHWLRFAPVFGDLGGHASLADEIARALGALREKGVAAALAAVA